MPSITRSAAAVFAAIGVLSLTSTATLAQQPATPTATSVTAIKRVQAARASRAGAIRLDGTLDENAWTEAQFISGFTQREPNEGAPSSDSTSVAFIYDEDALFIGARMRSSNPDAIRALVTRRDREGSSEQLIISLDTFRDRRTAYTFAVTAAGVRVDYFHGSDFEGSRDYAFDPVWEARTQVDSTGWTAEMRIPFSQLRFSAADEQLWGVNVVRLVPDRNESAYWMLVRRNDTGWSSRMGDLVGIRGVRPSRRIELLPYLATDTRFASNVNANNPFDERRHSEFRGGGDLKLGLGPNATLEATFNPDFGQVEA
ncbi:MAG: carbohydrate binding family 9 domain-containing protein, partial [Gemmatimonadaceae bacterium]